MLVEVAPSKAGINWFREMSFNKGIQLFRFTLMPKKDPRQACTSVELNGSSLNTAREWWNKETNTSRGSLTTRASGCTDSGRR